MQIRGSPFFRVLFLLILVTGCATKKYASTIPGVSSIGEMRVTIGEGWLRAPAADTPEKRSISRTLSRESIDRDRLMLIPGVGDGQSIFRGQGSATSLPLFEADMDSVQIANLVGQSMQRTLWNGSATVAATNAREHGFTGIPGFLFDLEVDIPSGPDHEGFAGSFVHEERLYVNIFIAESPAHFNQHMNAARQVIDSATLRVKTIRMSSVPRAGDLYSSGD